MRLHDFMVMLTLSQIIKFNLIIQSCLNRNLKIYQHNLEIYVKSYALFVIIKPLNDDSGQKPFDLFPGFFIVLCENSYFLNNPYQCKS